MATTKKYKAPAGMNPEDAKDWEKYGTFVHHFEGGPLYDAKGNPIKQYTESAKKTARKKKPTAKKKAK